MVWKLPRSTVVAAVKGQPAPAAEEQAEQIRALEEVLSVTRFFDVLERYWRDSNKSKDDFLIAIKPNLMMLYSINDTTSHTNPLLVEHLIDLIVDRGFGNVKLVESQNLYGNWFTNRDVLTVAEYVGYQARNYEIVDLTETSVDHHYGDYLGEHLVGPTWRNADFRISFAKNKTHFLCYYTLNLKNIYGTTPEQNKLKEYHHDRDWKWVTIETLRAFPVHFGLVDAWLGADGFLGFKGHHNPCRTRTILGGENIIAVDWVGAEKMGLNPLVNPLTRMAVAIWGLPEIHREGDMSRYAPWHNIMPGIGLIADWGEEWYRLSEFVARVLSFQLDPIFEEKTAGDFFHGVRRLMGLDRTEPTCADGAQHRFHQAAEQALESTEQGNSTTPWHL
jgi:uncharacterized protein (DUF362 family)